MVLWHGAESQSTRWVTAFGSFVVLVQCGFWYLARTKARRTHASIYTRILETVNQGVSKSTIDLSVVINCNQLWNPSSIIARERTRLTRRDENELSFCNAKNPQCIRSTGDTFPLKHNFFFRFCSLLQSALCVVFGNAMDRQRVHRWMDRRIFQRNTKNYRSWSNCDEIRWNRGDETKKRMRSLKQINSVVYTGNWTLIFRIHFFFLIQVSVFYLLGGLKTESRLTCVFCHKHFKKNLYSYTVLCWAAKK